MADVNRGQFVVVVAELLVTVLLVGLALVLNSGIYAENIRSRETASEPRDVQEKRSLMDEDLREMADRTNAEVEATDPSTLSAALQDGFQNYSGQRTLDGAKGGESIDVDLLSTGDGTRLRQTDESRNFTDRDGTVDWNLTDDVPDGGQFAMNVQEGSVYEATLDTTMAQMAESTFSIEFHLQDYTGSGDGVWRVYLFRGAATDSVYAVFETPEQTFEEDGLSDRTNSEHIVNGWLNQSCSLNSQMISIKLSEGTFGGTPCSEFEFYDQIDVHNVRFVNKRTDGTDRARGTYSILTKEADYNEDGFYSVAERTESKQPFFQSAIYELNYTYSYRTDSASYQVPDRNLSSESGDPGVILWEHPRIKRLDVAYLTPDETRNNSYRIDWRVTDQDAELERVEVELVDTTVEETLEEQELAANETFLQEEFGLNIIDSDDLNEYLEEMEISQPVNTKEVVAESRIDVSGADAQGTTTLVHDDGTASDSSEYRIKLTVTGASGRATPAGKHCEIDPTFCEEVDA